MRKILYHNEYELMRIMRHYCINHECRITFQWGATVEVIIHEADDEGFTFTTTDPLDANFNEPSVCTYGTVVKVVDLEYSWDETHWDLI
jgi:hypothetical protein